MKALRVAQHSRLTMDHAAVYLPSKMRCDGSGGVSRADQVVDVEDRSSDQAADRKDRLGSEGGELEDKLHQRIEEVEAGGN